MSFYQKWHFPDSEAHSLETQLLLNRDLQNKKDQAEFLNPPEPSFKYIFGNSQIDHEDFKHSVKRIFTAIDNHEKITIYGDYDADGITGTTILWETLHHLGADCLPYIPDRESEGYGLNKKALELLSHDHVGLIITVDCGITNSEEVLYAKKLGIDIIITDHHQPEKKIPSAFSIIHDTDLVGVSVAWTLAEGLKIQYLKKNPTSRKIHLNENWDLVAIGTIADLQPLLSRNRAFAKWGLEKLNHTKRIGLQKILESAGLRLGEITEHHIGFMISPRLNASGRLHDALDAVRLLCTQDLLQAFSLADSINKLNLQRQEMTLKSFDEAITKIPNLEDKKIIILQNESWHEGIVGLIASRVKEKYYRPSIAISLQNGIAKGSARSISGFNIIEALREVEDLLLHVGGHTMAAGFSLEISKITIFQERLEKIAFEKISPDLLENSLSIDSELNFSEINWDTLKIIEKFRPFGVGNYEPVFLIKNLKLKKALLIGKQKKHLKLLVSSEDSSPSFEVLAFGQGHLFSEFATGSRIDLACTLQKETWNGNSKISLKMKDYHFLE